MSCRILYSFIAHLYESGSGSITSVGMLGMGYVILLWHSPSLSYNYLAAFFTEINSQILYVYFSNFLVKALREFYRDDTTGNLVVANT